MFDKLMGDSQARLFSNAQSRSTIRFLDNRWIPFIIDGTWRRPLHNCKVFRDEQGKLFRAIDQ